MLMRENIDGRVVEWRTGYIGTAQYRADYESRRVARTAKGFRAMGEGAFEGLIAPSGRDEPCEQRLIGYSTPPTGGERARGLLCYLARERAERAKRAYRRAVMTAARDRATAARRAADRETWIDETPIVATLPPLDGLPLASCVRLASDKRVVGIGAYLDALDGLYGAYRRAARETAAMMNELPNDGRPPLVVPSSIGRTGTTNGQEVRASERWLSTPLRAVCGRDGRPIDRTCYVIAPDGSRAPFEPPVPDETPNRRKRTGGMDAGQAYSTRLAAFGADMSLAVGD